MATFGKETVGSYTNIVAYKSIAGSYYSCTEAGTAESITGYFVRKDTGKLKCAIYKRSTKALVAYTEEKTITTDGFMTFDVTWGGTLEATDYYLVVMGEDDSAYLRGDRIGYTGVGLDQYHVVYGAFPSTWSGYTVRDYAVDIYCTYTPKPPATSEFFQLF